MIEGLDRVAWAELSHAYGRADDVPDLLHRMSGTDETDVITAQGELRGSILHQGSVCTATTPAVPFLGALLADPTTVHPGGIAHLLGDMADIRDPDNPVLTDLRAAVTTQVDRLLPLLTSADAYTRQVTAFALAQCPARAPKIIPALRESWTTEPDPAVRGSLVIAIATLDPNTDLLRDALAAHHPPGVRAGAAIAAGRAGRWSADAVAAARAGWAARDPWFDRDDPEWPHASEIGYPWNWDPIDDLLAHADPPPTVTALLASAHPAVREKAAQLGGTAAGESRSMREPMAAALTPALSDPDPRVRATAAWGIRRTGAVPDALVTLARHDPGEAGDTALLALVERGDPRARDLLPTRLTADVAAALAADGTLVLPPDRPSVPPDRPAEGPGVPSGEEPAVPSGRSVQGPTVLPGRSVVGPAVSPGQSADGAVLPPRRTAVPPPCPTLISWQRKNRPQSFLGSYESPTRADEGLYLVLLDVVRRRLVALPADVPFDADAPFDLDVELARLRAGERTVSHDAERRALVDLLASWGPDAAPAVPELITLLAENQAVTAVAKALAAIGDTAAVPALRAVTGQHRLAAVTAIWRLTGDPEPAVETVADLLDTDEDTDKDVLELIAELGDPARRLLPRLRERLARDPGVSRYDQSRHVALARLVWQWTGDPAAARAAARTVMATGSPEPRAEAADLAAELGDSVAVDTLRAVLTGHDSWARLLAAQALWRHTGDAEVSTLTEILTSRPNEGVLQAALDTLIEFGAAAWSAIPTLRALAVQDATVVYDANALLDEAARAAIQATVTVISSRWDQE